MEYKMYIRMMTLVLIGVLFSLSCKKEKSDDNLLLAGLLLLSRPSAENSTSDLNTPVGRAVSISSAISGISSGVAAGPSAGITMKSKNPLEDAQRYAMNAVLVHGKDSLIARNAIRDLFKIQASIASKNHKAPSAEKRLTAWSSSSTDSEGYTSYTFSGTAKGYKYVTVEADVGSYTSNGGTCKVSSYSFTTGRTEAGSAAFTNGVYKTKTSGNSSSSTGQTSSSRSSGDIVFSNYGTLYADMFKSIAFFKKVYGSGGIFSNFTSNTKPTCEAYQNFYKEFNATYNAATIDGNLSYSTTNDFVFSFTGSTSKSVGTFVSTANASVGVKLTQGGVTVEGVTFKDLKLTAVSDLSFTSATSSAPAKYSGKYTITIAGIVSGSPINETIAVTFD